MHIPIQCIHLYEFIYDKLRLFQAVVCATFSEEYPRGIAI